MRYEFVCMECDYTVELSRSIHDDSPALCRVCSHAMQKVYTAPPIHFRGPDFYAKGAK